MLVADLRGRITITIRRSKLDPEGEGTAIGVPRGRRPASCLVRALTSWLAAAAIGRGTIFRGISCHGHVLGRLSGRDVVRIVKRRGAAAGIAPAGLAGHSLRAGFATAAADGADLAQIMQQTRHRSAATTRRYVRRGTVFVNRAVRALRL
jgi:integrase